MTKTQPRYNGIVNLGSTYVTPAGVLVIPVAFTVAGIKVEFPDKARIVARRDFAAYVKV